MQGDPRVDTIMWPILLVIRRYVKNLDAVTDIYNRAYEAVMNSVDVIDTSAKVTARQIAENAKNLQRVVELEAALKEANEDAERFAKKHTYRDRMWGITCVYCGSDDYLTANIIRHTADCPITLHRARVNGKLEGGGAVKDSPDKEA